MSSTLYLTLGLACCSLAPTTPFPSRTSAERMPFPKKVYEFVTPLKQPKGNDCWIATYTMMRRWKDKQHALSIEQVLAGMKPVYANLYKNNSGLPGTRRAAFFVDNGLTPMAPQNFTLAGWASLIQDHGPVSVDVFSQNVDDMVWMHALLLVGVDTDTQVFTYIDPATGKEDSTSFLEFLRKYEGVVTEGDQHDFIQVFHL